MIHSYLMFVFSAIMSICVVLIILKQNFSWFPYLILLPYSILITLILHNANKCALSINTTLLADNSKINVENKLYCVISFVCNYFYYIARIVTTLIILIFLLVLLSLSLEMHGRYLPGRWWDKLMSLYTTIFTQLAIITHEKREIKDPFEDTTTTTKKKKPKYEKVEINPPKQNENMFNIYKILHPNQIFDAINPFPNYKANSMYTVHIVGFLIGLIAAILYAIFFIDSSKDSDTNSDSEIKTKKQFIIGIALVSTILTMYYTGVCIVNVVMN